jgi:hypothetical protein
MRSATILTPVAVLLAASGMAAQEHSVTLRGIVFDSTTGYALSDVAIHLNQSLQPVRTDTLGEFALTGLSIGSHTLTMAKQGYGPRVFWFSVTENHRDTVEVGPFPLAATETLTAAVSGSVLDSRTGQPVIAAGVSVNGDLAAFSSDSGFTTGRLEVLPGLNTVEFKRVGYEPFTVSLWAVRNHTDLDLAVTLDPLPVQIPMVVVEADQTTHVFGELREFYRRRQWGLGHYFTQQDIEEQHPLLISDMLRMTPGVVVRSGMSGGNRVEVIGYRAMKCLSMNLFIDGHHVMTGSSEDLDLLVHPDNVAAIEVYPRPAQIPVQFKMRGSVCGVIAVWTRR